MFQGHTFILIIKPYSAGPSKPCPAPLLSLWTCLHATGHAVDSDGLSLPHGSLGPGWLGFPNVLYTRLPASLCVREGFVWTAFSPGAQNGGQDLKLLFLLLLLAGPVRVQLCGTTQDGEPAEILKRSLGLWLSLRGHPQLVLRLRNLSFWPFLAVPLCLLWRLLSLHSLVTKHAASVCSPLFNPEPPSSPFLPLPTFLFRTAISPCPLFWGVMEGTLLL